MKSYSKMVLTTFGNSVRLVINYERSYRPNDCQLTIVFSSNTFRNILKYILHFVRTENS